MTVSKTLVILYFKGECLPEEEALVERWLLEDEGNAQVALGWIGELSDEEEKLVMSLSFKRNEIWKKTTAEIRSDKENGPIAADFGRNRLFESTWYRMAAVLTGLLLTVFAYHFYSKHQRISITTSENEVRTFFLPDSSRVILNRNSTLSYSKVWDNASREVWLEGEGFFEVKHLITHSRFQVHLSNDKAIEVLGTEFNISERADKSYIVLKSGKIKLDLPDDADQEDIFLKPGDLVQITATKEHKSTISRSVVEPETWYGWIYGKWILERTTLREMLTKLEENYGARVQVRDKALLDKQVSGSIPLSTANADLLIADIADLFELKIIRENNIVVLVE